MHLWWWLPPKRTLFVMAEKPHAPLVLVNVVAMVSMGAWGWRGYWLRRWRRRGDGDLVKMMTVLRWFGCGSGVGKHRRRVARKIRAAPNMVY
nr:hypothetical protein [Tanacetum cinerariifolium]